MCATMLVLMAIGGGPPQELQRVLSGRVPRQTWRIEFTVTHGADSPITEQQMSGQDGNAVQRTRTIYRPQFTEYLISERVADTLREINKGDEEGRHPLEYQRVMDFLEHDADPYQTVEMHDYEFAEPHYTLLYDGKIWNKKGTGVSAAVQTMTQHSPIVPYDLV